MVQFIQRVHSAQRSPSVGQRLSEGLGRGLETASQYMRELEQKKAQEMQYQQENEAVKRLIGEDISGVQDPKIRQMYIQDALSGRSKQQESERSRVQSSQNEMDQFNRQQELQRQKYGFEEELQRNKPPKPIKPVDTSKVDKQKEDEKKIHDTAQNSFNTIVKTLKKGNLGRGSGVMSFFGGETAKDTGKFLSSSAGLEAMLVDMVSRGTLSNSRFQYITETILPKPTDSQAEIEGKLEALAELLGLDSSELKSSESKGESSKGKQSLEDIFK